MAPEAKGHPARVAIVATHPVQYSAPWFRELATRSDLRLRVFYLWDFGVARRFDPGFQQPLVWDVDLLHGYDHEFVPNRSPRPALGKFFGFWNPSLIARLREFDPDAVLTLGYNFASLARLIFSSYADTVPLLFRGDSHRLVSRAGLLERLRSALIAMAFRRFKAFLYVGTANREYFTMHGVPEGRLFHAPHAVDNRRFFSALAEAPREAARWKRALGIPDDHLVVLFAGKMEHKKRPLDLLRAFRSSRIDGASLLFVGSGPLESRLKSEAAGLGNVYFAPFQNQTQMPRTYAAADLFVLPSFGPGETWGLAVNEAMCMGKAVVVSDHVGCAQDLVRAGDNGLIFEAGSAEDLARCLRLATSDVQRLRSWGIRSREIIEGYSYAHVTEGLMKALSTVLPSQ